jgi:hypothetical protein
MLFYDSPLIPLSKTDKHNIAQWKLAFTCSSIVLSEVCLKEGKMLLG